MSDEPLVDARAALERYANAGLDAAELLLTQTEARAILAALDAPKEHPSSVQIEETAKKVAMVRVKVYAGETEAEMDRLKNLAVATHQKTNAMLGLAASGS